jgi:hypothetical protein
LRTLSVTWFSSAVDTERLPFRSGPQGLWCASKCSQACSLDHGDQLVLASLTLLQVAVARRHCVSLRDEFEKIRMGRDRFDWKRTELERDQMSALRYVSMLHSDLLDAWIKTALQETSVKTLIRFGPSTDILPSRRVMHCHNRSPERSKFLLAGTPARQQVDCFNLKRSEQLIDVPQLAHLQECNPRLFARHYVQKPLVMQEHDRVANRRAAYAQQQCDLAIIDDLPGGKGALQDLGLQPVMSLVDQRDRRRTSACACYHRGSLYRPRYCSKGTDPCRGRSWRR